MPIVEALTCFIPKDNDTANKVVSQPYDIISSEEAREISAQNPDSFVRVVRPEVNFPKNQNPYDQKVYLKAREILDEMLNKHYTKVNDVLFVYSQSLEAHTQYGIIGLVSAKDYFANKIKRHEKTREEKERDRMNHIAITRAHTGLAFLMHKPNKGIKDIIQEVIKSSSPIFDVNFYDGTTHKLWLIKDEEIISNLKSLYAQIDAFYIADGHHRVAASSKLSEELPEAELFPATIFSTDELNILPYNRIILEIPSSYSEIINQSSNAFILEEVKDVEVFDPPRSKEIGMYIPEKWYKLIPKPETYDKEDPIKSLDTYILQENLIGPVLGITDPRKDKRIDFLGGIGAAKKVKAKVDNGIAKMAFTLHPVTTDDIIRVADANEVMPPKSTWFEPKLLSGFIVHKF